MNVIEAHRLLEKRNDYKTSHLLHLLLSVLSAGLWLVVWLLVADYNANKRRKIDKQLEALRNDCTV